jgi:hypothetical protein
MTIVGKILVVLNLVFALVVGGFLTIDYATRTNWKNRYDELKREMEVSNVNSKTTGDIYVARANEFKNLQAKLDAEMQNRKNDKIVFDVELADLNNKWKEEIEKARSADLTAKTAQASVARLLEEAKGLAAAIKTREITILKIEEDNRNLRAAAIANENLSKALQVRNENLLEQLMQARKVIAGFESGNKGGIAEMTNDPNRPNPPSVFVKGQIEKVDGKDGLVEISIGSDQGLKKYNTLEVYRLNPKAEYLGTLRVVEVYNHKAVGRLIQNTFATRKTVRQGDQVASSLERP